MYDPMIVDTFFQVHPTALTELPRQGPPSEVLNTIARSRQASSISERGTAVGEIPSSADELLTVYELTRALAGQTRLADAGNETAKHLRRLIPSSLCVVYVYDRQTDELEARHAVGEGSSTIRGLRMPLGQRLSGWVAANRKTIANSDARLDLAEAVKSQSLRLKSCISTPLIYEDELIGVLSLYSSDLSAFTEDHKRIIETISKQVAHAFKSATRFESTRDALAGFPSLQQLE
jgi:GAF domain-containing protein